MKKITWLFVFISVSNFLAAQNVGIGTTTPLSNLHIKGGLLLDSTNGGTPVSGAGTRLMWIPAKEAFRAGRVDASQWDADSIGIRSVAFGWDTKAKGQSSLAVGYSTNASGGYSIALGQSTKALGGRSIAAGYFSEATGINSFSLGGFTKANGIYSLATGYATEAKGDLSNASGSNTKASGTYSLAAGYFTTSKSFAGTVVGLYNDSTDAASAVIYNPSNRIFQVGNGTDDNARSNAMTVLQSGRIGIGTTTPQSLFHTYNGSVLFDGTTGSTPVSGAGIRLMWIPAKEAFRAGHVTSDNWNDDSIGTGSVAFGINTKAKGPSSTAMGNSSSATGNHSTAMGLFSVASGYSSTAMGFNTNAAATYSTAMGNSTKAHGANAVAMGFNSIANGNNSIAIGEYSNANGINSVAMGYLSTASGNNATAIGYLNSATGQASTALCGSNYASGYNSLATGWLSNATGDIASAIGVWNASKSYGGTVVGLYNDSANAANANTIHQANRIFQIGNGTADNARSNAMTVLQNGNIGIGELAPVTPLSFASSLGNKISLWGNSATSNYGLGIQASLLQMYSNSATSDIAFGYGGSTAFIERMRIKGNGNVGIGVINPSFLLDIGDRMRLRNGSWGTAGLYFNKNDNSTTAAFIGTYSNDNYVGFYGENGAGWSLLVNGTNGNVGIGTDAPSQKLHVNGNICYTGSIAACSDIRYKKNIQPLNNSLNKILSLQGISYNWNKEKFKDNAFSDERQIGFSAQEIEKMFPELIQTDSNGYKAVDYSRLTPVLVEAVKEQQKQIDDQAKKIEWLMKEMQTLKENRHK